MSGELHPAGYGEVLARLTAEMRAARIAAQRTANVSLLSVYWTIGSGLTANLDGPDNIGLAGLTVLDNTSADGTPSRS